MIRPKTYQRFVPLIFGHIMKEKRIALKMEQETLANKISTSRASVCYFENGRTAMNIETYFKICEILEIDGNEIFKRAREYQKLKEIFP